jgi:hypothetical protein
MRRIRLVANLGRHLYWSKARPGGLARYAFRKKELEGWQAALAVFARRFAYERNGASPL